MKRLVPLGLASLASLALMAPQAATAADVALVIGNHDCRGAPDALSARADARAVADALAERGYRVTTGTDLERGASADIVTGAEALVTILRGIGQ